MKNLRLFLTLALSLVLLSGCGTRVKPPESVLTSAPPSATPAATPPAPGEPNEPKTIVLKSLPVLELPLKIKEISNSSDAYPRMFTWEYGGKTWKWEMQLPEAFYRYFKALPRVPTENFSIYITHRLDDALINSMASELTRVAQAEGLSRLQTAELATAFAQSPPYMLDLTTMGVEEYQKYPVETLVDFGGDCEDKSTLLASLLTVMGYKVILIVFPGEHGAIGIESLPGMQGTSYRYSGSDFYYVETTDSGWEIGQVPDEYQGLAASFYEIKPVPVLTHYFSASGSGLNLKVDVTVENQGTSDAQDVSVLVGFDGGEEKSINFRESPVFNLAQDGNNTISLVLTAPPGKHTRLVIEVKTGSESVGKSFSDWFDTPPG